MRIAFFVPAVLLAASLNCAAKNLSDWTAVQKLKAGTEVLVVDVFNNRADGYVASVSTDELKIDVMVVSQPGLLSPQTFSRTRVSEVYRVGKMFERRLGARNILLSSVIGLVAGVAVGAAVDQSHPSAEDPGQGKLVGGVVGFFAGPAALAVGRAILSAVHKSRLIYRAPTAETHKQEPVADATPASTVFTSETARREWVQSQA